MQLVDKAKQPVDGPNSLRPVTILVAEDHKTLRSVVVSVLKQAGYRVLDVENGLDALRLSAVERHHHGVDLLVTDIDMPLLPGPEAAVRMMSFYPHMKTLLMSGHGPEKADLSDLPEARFLQKPFSRVELLETVRDLLHG